MNLLGAPVLVVGVGAQTAVGMTAPATAGAVRAGVAGFEKHPFVLDTKGDPMIVAAAPYLPPNLTGTNRLRELARAAAAEAMTAFAAVPGEKPPVPVFLGLPPVRPGRGEDAPPSVADRLQEGLAGVCRVARIEAIETGHAAGAMALKAAWGAVRSGTEFALAGGIDSYLDPETLEWLEANDQVHSAGPANNAWGFVPGEAAGFVLLASAVAVKRFRLIPSFELLTAATTRETKLIKTDAVCLGEGLTDLFRSLASGLAPGIRVDQLYCDQNGEAYRADEFGFAALTRRGPIPRRGIVRRPGRLLGGRWRGVRAAFSGAGRSGGPKGVCRGAHGRGVHQRGIRRAMRLGSWAAGRTGGTVMGLTIKVNGENNSLAHKGSTGISTATIPDVCKTPSPGGPVPIPYPNVAMSSDLAKGTTTVKVDGGNMAAIKGSEFSRSTGDEAGTAGGATSSTFIKEATWILYSFDVKLDGQNACRLTDKMFHNHQNTVDAAGVVQYPVSVVGTEAQLRELAKRCNESVNKKHGLCPASSRPAGRPTGDECKKLGDEKHKCCEKAIKREKKKGGLSDMESEQAYNSKNKPIAAIQGRSEVGRQGSIHQVSQQARPIGHGRYESRWCGEGGARRAEENGPSSRDLCQGPVQGGQRASVSGRRADREAAGRSPEPPNVTEAYDFKFSCKANDDIRADQQKQYTDCTGIPAKAIHHQGTKC